MSKNPLGHFDYRVGCDDFLLYELGRLIEEERASLEDEEFRRVIESGIHEHIERRLDVRAEMALQLRKSGQRSTWILRSIENIEARLSDVLEVIESYTAYMFERLEQCSEAGPDERITTAADMLLDSPEDRDVAGPAVDLLGNMQSAVSARILAHVVSEPMLPEDIEAKAYDYLQRLWPLPRHYIVYSLKPHDHEDLPFRWFQLLVDCDEPSAVDRILEEVVVHGSDDDYRQDLLALIELLEQARDPETEDKILQIINTEKAPAAVVNMLQDFLRSTPGRRHTPAEGPNPWSDLDRPYIANRRYVEAARLFDSGRKAEAARAIEELLKEDPQYPFALMLKQLLQEPRAN